MKHSEISIHVRAKLKKLNLQRLISIKDFTSAVKKEHSAFMSGKNSYSDLKDEQETTIRQKAFDNIADKLVNFRDYSGVDINDLNSIAQFESSHRPSITWAVLKMKSLEKEGKLYNAKT